MPYYRQLGLLPPKRHTKHRREGGYKNEGIYYEEVVTTMGFSRAYSIAYHLKPPTRVTKVEPAGQVEIPFVSSDQLRHLHTKTKELPSQGDMFSGRIPIYGNADVLISRCRPKEPQKELYRNAAADEIIFVHSGQGKLVTMLGEIIFKPFDYLVIPRTFTYRLDFANEMPADLLVIETPHMVGFPPRYHNPDGQFRLGAPFCERDIRGPSSLVTLDQEQPTSILIKDGSRLTRYTMAHHPFDVVGWDGMVYPFAFNADDFEPITGAIHQPPPIHQTFETAGFVVCTFAPRLLDYHPDAIKVPYAHSNVESDEVLFYVRGDFKSRRGVEIGSFTLHPRGIPHGPHPGTIVASDKATRTDELAVMVDTFRPLQFTQYALEMDDPKYPYSWLD